MISTGKQDCNPKAEYHNFDISDSNNEEIKSVISGADGIFHLDSMLYRVQDSIENPFFEINNTIGTVNMLNLANECF